MMRETPYTTDMMKVDTLVLKTFDKMATLDDAWDDWPLNALTSTNPVYKQIYKSIWGKLKRPGVLNDKIKKLREAEENKEPTPAGDDDESKDEGGESEQSELREEEFSTVAVAGMFENKAPCFDYTGGGELMFPLLDDPLKGETPEAELEPIGW
jgi:hypothetical protein